MRTRPTRIVDVGALNIDEIVPNAYTQLLGDGTGVCIGFDPQFARVPLPNSRMKTDWRLIGDGGQVTLHVYRAPGLTSIYPIDPRAMKMFPDLVDWGCLEGSKVCNTFRLDDIEEVDCIDWLKMDVQGAETKVLAGARKKLAGAVVVQTEMQFAPLYEGAPRFDDLHIELDDLGFRFHGFYSMQRWALYTPGSAPVCTPHQLFSADAIYVRGLYDLSELSTEQLEHLVAIMRCYQSIDLAQECERELKSRESLPDHPAVPVPAR